MMLPSIDKITGPIANIPNVGEQQSNSDVFQQIFSAVLSGGGSNSQGDIDLSANNIEEIITNSQQVLFGGLGLAIPENGTFSKLDSTKLEDSVNKMQNALISSLKSSMQVTSELEPLANGEGRNQVLLSFVGSADGTEIEDASGRSIDEGALSTTTQVLEEIGPVQELAFGEDGAGTEDIIDTVNIFNHIPIVSGLYRGLTGADEPSPASKILGAGLFAGPIGVGVASVGVGIEQFSDIKISELLPWSGLTDEVADKAKGLYASATDEVDGE